MKDDKVALNCEILKETDDFLAAFKRQAAEDRNLARVSYGWVVDELVRIYKRQCNSTKSLQELGVNGRLQ